MFDQALNELLFICVARLNGYLNSPAYHNLEEKLEVDMKHAAAVLGKRFNINDMLHIKVAEQLGLLDMVDTELRYYTYNMEKDDTVSPWKLAPQIMQNLLTKRYLLVVQNLDRPIKPIKLDDTTEGLRLPKMSMTGATSQIMAGSSNPLLGMIY